MFDIGFWELAVIGVVALLVVGPERLPGLARTVGLYVGKLKRWVTQVRGEVERELRAEELRQAMRKAETSETLGSISKAVKGEGVADAMRNAGESMRSAAEGIARDGGGAAAAPADSTSVGDSSGAAGASSATPSETSGEPAPRAEVERERGPG